MASPRNLLLLLGLLCLDPLLSTRFAKSLLSVPQCAMQGSFTFMEMNQTRGPAFILVTIATLSRLAIIDLIVKRLMCSLYLAFPLPLMGWIYGVGKYSSFSYSSFSFLLLLQCIYWLYISSFQEKFLTPNELAKMPSCNLAEIVLNKWLQASGNKGGDLYIAAVDDYIRAFLQVVVYYQYLKGGVGRMGPSREELKLKSAQRRAQRTSDLGIIQSALLGMPGADEFCTHDPHHEGAEVFGSQKRKPDTPIGADEDSHRPNTINFSRPRPPKRVTRSHASTLPTIVERMEGSVEQVHALPPSGTDICHVTAIQESNINERT